MGTNTYHILEHLDIPNETVARGFLLYGNCGWCSDSADGVSNTDIIAMARCTDGSIPNLGFWDGVCATCSDEWASLWPCERIL